MPNSKKKTISVVAGDYTFIFSDRRLIAVPIPIIKRSVHKNKERLKVIVRAYKEYKRAVKPVGRPLSGEWRWCMNPKCYNAFYALRSKIEQGKGLFCSHSCTGKVFGFKKGE